MLFEPPFKDMDDQGGMGVFDDASSHKIISIVESINENALHWLQGDVASIIKFRILSRGFQW
jgi:hypothetical protein